jgi:NhaC family Na+:H+ antiporter
MITSVPSILIALGLYTFFGFTADPAGALSVDAGLAAIEESYYTGIIPMIPLLIVIVLAIRKVPPMLAITAGAIAGSLISVIWQREQVLAFVDDPELSTPWAMLKGTWTAMANGYEPSTGYEQLDELLSGGGMEGILGTVWLIMVALAFGGVMNECGFLRRLIEPLHRIAKGDRGIMISTGVTAIGINVLAADQYLAIVLTGNVYKQDFAEHGIAPNSLSRQIEDTATITSPLIPWNSCGAYASGVLGVATASYAPFAFFNWINPIISFTYAALGIGIKKVEPSQESAPSPHDTDFYGVAGRRADEVPRED